MNLYEDCYTRIFTEKAKEKVFPIIDKYIEENIDLEKILSKLDKDFRNSLENNNDMSLFELYYYGDKVKLSYFDYVSEEEIYYEIDLEEKFYYGLEPDYYDYSDGYYLYGTKEERIEEAKKKIIEIEQHIETLSKIN